MSEAALSETVLLKCNYIDGKIERYIENKITKVEKENDPTKEYEIQINPVIQKIINAPFYGIGLKFETWQDDYVVWMYEGLLVDYLSQYTFNLDKVTGILSKDYKTFIRKKNEIGNWYKGSNGEWVKDLQWHVSSEYQCKKEDRLF